ncbi:hypothetical protein FFLO_04944 [Filobasidium floriforme]|uniref:Tubulin-specific chaperone A n=1 Tax=Filobasidium floriforme TaxID=5210 RepID=A0A8K0JHY4_9TREE|nr:tubulin binding cofactor A [Filobasidium floriforme]KAG7530581.1 hypothetical protein FFLO_04944 [Filobasidium floriforme]KAH8086396.1 tubulin binding cofactor A [Filobasidium floriforme]
MSDSVKQITRQLTIKTGSLKRLAKEVDLYKKEYAEQSHVVERLSSANGDEWELKNARKVLKDCEQMLAPSQERVKEAFDDLSALVEDTAEEEEIVSTAEYGKAKELLGQIDVSGGQALE